MYFFLTRRPGLFACSGGGGGGILPPPEPTPAVKCTIRPHKTPISRAPGAHDTPNGAHWVRIDPAIKLGSVGVSPETAPQTWKICFLCFWSVLGLRRSEDGPTSFRHTGPLQGASRPRNRKKSLHFEETKYHFRNRNEKSTFPPVFLTPRPRPDPGHLGRKWL